MSHPTVSVIIPCYNAAAYIEETLDSVYRQQGVDLEVIAVDDGSTDETAAIIAARYPQVRLERTPNRGPSAARNLGTSLATAAYIQYLDADDLLADGKLACQIRMLEESGADVAYGDWIRFSTGASGNRLGEETISWSLGPDPEIDLFTTFWCPPAAYLLRKRIVEATGGWNPRLPIVQDARFMMDCALHGARFIRCPGTMAYYRRHQSGSVSTRNAIAFSRDVLTNAIEIQEWWSSRGRLDERRRIAVGEVCRQIAVASFRRDPETYRRARAILLSVAPGAMANQSRRIRLAARLFGAGPALSLELYLNRCKSAVLSR